MRGCRLRGSSLIVLHFTIIIYSHRTVRFHIASLTASRRPARRDQRAAVLAGKRGYTHHADTHHADSRSYYTDGRLYVEQAIRR